MKLFGHIPFATLAQRHLVYAYCTVWILQFGYAVWIWSRFHKERDEPGPRSNLRQKSA